MRTKLTAVEDGLGVVIEKPLLEQVGLAEGADLDVTVDGDRIVIAPARRDRRERVAGAIAEVMADHAGTFRRLAR
jgi:antitoxin component of MazEF toxin-antitoxin module